MGRAHTTNYVDTFIAVAHDCTASVGLVPSPRKTPSVAELTYAMIVDNPYRFTSDDVVFGVWAMRQGLAAEAWEAARTEFFAKGRACLRSSDLGKRYGWGVHADSQGRVALYPVNSIEYLHFMSGADVVTVTRAMKSSRAK
ncbi:hypothetical protein EH165_09720 [Nakamurella antarctica]|uniref:Uncharacterized protein n=1 Tax=Nakamurella antarctica TaxID=1902245 RepID=A0A3G8ZNL4_9ACTN|nr:DUF6157 family protein [Nakamurella antarctica]AZI58375.1 hypothetical protein EH165_09720 [Nakamurella antarctica]